MTEGLSEHHHLRHGRGPWLERSLSAPDSDALPEGVVDVAIVGAGIMGSILAERLSDEAHRVALLDCRPPAHGSTAASTAQIMSAMDVPLTHLAARIGEEEAVLRWRRVFEAVRELSERIDRLGLDAAMAGCPTLYLEGNVLDAQGLMAEAQLRARNGLPSAYLDAADVAQRFGVAARAGIVSEGGYEIDPVRLTHALLRRAREHGASVTFPADVEALHPGEDAVDVETTDGRHLHARHVILASGYERARLFLPAQFSLLSTFVIATPPGTAPLWRENAMIWEAADPYLYVRTDKEGRIIAGGEDVESCDAIRRDELLPSKAGTIAAQLEALVGTRITIERSWAATFGFSPDGLPAIGRAASMDRVWLSAGFGGNGIAFAALAAELLSGVLAGRPDPDLAAFDPYRFTSSHTG